MDNAYKVPNVDVRGYCCKTNLQSNTAFRGFGGPQGLLVVENFMDELACDLEMDPAELREKNLYQEGDTAYFSQTLNHCTLKRCWEECRAQSNYEEQCKRVVEFNEKNKWKKRGISMIPTKFGIAFSGPHMNQAGALVQVMKLFEEKLKNCFNLCLSLTDLRRWICSFDSWGNGNGTRVIHQNHTSSKQSLGNSYRLHSHRRNRN